MKYETTISYTEAMIIAAAKKYWLRKYFSDAVLSILVLGAVSYFFFVEGYQNWAVGFLFAIALIYTITVYAVFFVWRGRSLAMYRAMGTPLVKWSFTEDAFISESGAGKAELKWPTIKKLWRYNDVWLLFYASGAYSTLPVETLSNEAKNFIEQKIRETGGHIA